MTRVDFQILLLPFLESLRDGERSPDHVHTELTRYVELSDEAIKSQIPVGNVQAFIRDATSQCREHLMKTELIEETREGSIRITALGKMVLNRRLNSLDIEYLRRLPGYR